MENTPVNHLIKLQEQYPDGIPWNVAIEAVTPPKAPLPWAADTDTDRHMRRTQEMYRAP